MNTLALYHRHQDDVVADIVPADSIVDWLPDDCTSIGCITSLDVWEICRLDAGQTYVDISGCTWERIA